MVDSVPIVRYAEESGTMYSAQLKLICIDTLADIPTILDIIRALAAYEHASDSVLATEETLKKTLSFGPSPSNGYARTLLIFSPPTSVSPDVKGPDPACCGMALYFHNYSTWRAAPGIYLEDLFIRPEYRKRGYGKRLLQELAHETKRIGGTRLEWSVLKWNKPSIDFYKSLGAEQMDEWVGNRLDFAALDQMAQGQSLLKR